MSGDYVSIPVRAGVDGFADKAALLDAEAWKWAQSQPIQQLALKLIVGAGNDAALAARKITAFVRARHYRREPGEIFRPADSTAIVGGDCDDLALLAAALLRAVGLPAKFEYSFRADGTAKHVWIAYRAPAASQAWVTFDPVEASEYAWMQGNVPVVPEPETPWLLILLVGGIGCVLGMRLSSQK